MKLCGDKKEIKNNKMKKKNKINKWKSNGFLGGIRQEAKPTHA